MRSFRKSGSNLFEAPEKSGTIMGDLCEASEKSETTMGDLCEASEKSGTRMGAKLPRTQGQGWCNFVLRDMTMYFGV
eukprot:8470377-Heterocapsa_arctica.AAC.1